MVGFLAKIKQNSGGRAIYPSSERQLKPWEKMSIIRAIFYRRKKNGNSII
uniref:Uncharacterized protein n=1 Tax=Salmonella sp. TaxID=599 RepID=A0A6M4NLW8_SALSP|nr:hypothetical protein [Salmonella sp.]